MSDHVPFDIQVEIIKRLPLKSLIQFRSVSKPWKSLIDSSRFITDHSINHAHRNHLLVRYKEESERKYVSIVDDVTFPQQKSSFTAPPIVNLIRHALVLGSYQGLFCLYGFYEDHDSETEIIAFWNPSIRKSIGIAVSDVLYMPQGLTVIGFGICPNTSDPKLVKITHHNSPSEFDTINNCIPWLVQVFTLSSGTWRCIPVNLPRKSIALTWNQVLIDGVIYWRAFDNIAMGDGSRNLIISFDLTTEEFGEICLPERLLNAKTISVCNLRESLVVVEDYEEAEKPVSDVWMIKHGVPNSFEKQFTIKARDNLIYNRLLEIRKNGEFIMETIDEYEELSALEVYEPSSKCINDVGICGTFFSVTSYTESLLLLNYPESIIY